jgi:hypothetical protein
MYFWPGDQLGAYALAFALVNCTGSLPSGFIEKI